MATKDTKFGVNSSLNRKPDQAGHCRPQRTALAQAISIALVASQVYESVIDYHILLPTFVILAFMLSRKHTASNG